MGIDSGWNARFWLIPPLEVKRGGGIRQSASAVGVGAGVRSRRVGLARLATGMAWRLARRRGLWRAGLVVPGLSDAMTFIAGVAETFGTWLAARFVPRLVLWARLC